MSLLDVDHIKRRLILVLLVQFVERGNLPAKRRSSMASKYKHYGSLAAKGGELNPCLPVGSLQ